MALFKLRKCHPREDDHSVMLPELETHPEAQVVRLHPDDSIEALKPFLGNLSLIILNFPVFRDGRAFTQARALREYEHYRGEIRVEGHILPDQAEFLKQCGVDTVVLPEGSDVTLWEEQLKRFSFSYQETFFSKTPSVGA
ncbi:DUF934 domain-containing protein [Saccharibacter sp. 17.LH.SD]|uniref:DUF934 domain-containing protein n=1 Tax=Saccharibacter sp. 17.LH.SD TaxID=2689393 RepID=UPI00136EB0D8|nr:DUF934 domain-containing protein [Saccharibacter sp. 17.LH.SD]MXV45091.1 DUF934 domain-containing protein [Saccharibacter sp. 17.LH.SD]